MANKGVLFVAVFFFLGTLLVIFQGNGIKGMATEYFLSQGYICQDDQCYRCTIQDQPCFCAEETCTCGDKTVDKKMCTVKLLWKEVPRD